MCIKFLFAFNAHHQLRIFDRDFRRRNIAKKGISREWKKGANVEFLTRLQKFLPLTPSGTLLRVNLPDMSDDQSCYQ